jgi:hypothetical protein
VACALFAAACAAFWGFRQWAARRAQAWPELELKPSPEHELEASLLQATPTGRGAKLSAAISVASCEEFKSDDPRGDAENGEGFADGRHSGSSNSDSSEGGGNDSDDGSKGAALTLGGCSASGMRAGEVAAASVEGSAAAVPTAQAASAATGAAASSGSMPLLRLRSEGGLEVQVVVASEGERKVRRAF